MIGLVDLDYDSITVAQFGVRARINKNGKREAKIFWNNHAASHIMYEKSCESFCATGENFDYRSLGAVIAAELLHPDQNLVALVG